PSAAEKLAILKSSTEQLLEAGYRYIGMDHFAKPDDELSLAQDNGTLYRNFQGYSTHSECDLVALGNTGIGMVGRSYSQNEKGLPDYHERIANGEIPVFRGVELTDDDLLRRDIITRLICDFGLDFAGIEARHNIQFGDYFAAELQVLQTMQQDGLLEFDAKSIRVHPGGRLLIRNICMVFDRYLPKATQQRFSKVI
ncbi:MAG: coproporphyrinogen III oxidase, partial [Gammaproteobacteria bacterium]